MTIPDRTRERLTRREPGTEIMNAVFASNRAPVAEIRARLTNRH